MLNIFISFKEIFSSAITQIAAENSIQIEEKDLKNFTVEPTKDKSHGDLACNIAMILGKKFSAIESLNNPRKLAQKIIEKTDKKDVEKIEIAGPGFINLFLKPHLFNQVIGKLVLEEKFEFPNLGNGIKVNLEYASPNPTGPIHIGHTRGAIYGDVLATLLQKCGFDVLREYYINDAGSQITILLKSAYLRYLQACGKNVEIPEGLYPGEYLIPIGEKIKEKFGKNLVENLEKIRDFVVDAMVETIKSDLLALGIKHDSYFSEKKNLHDTGKIEKTLKILEEKNLVYVGKLEAPKTEKGVGALPEGYDEKDQTLFSSTKFGDDQDRVVKKADGTPTYFAGDIAYVTSKFERGAKIFIMPLGYDHAGYVKRLTAAVEALTHGQAQLKIILCQMVKFVKNGAPLKMSKRTGNFITAREVIDEVGADALRFIMLTRKNDAPFDFDLAKVIEQSKDNPIFYVQYAHARCCSVLRQAQEVMGLKTGSSNLKLLADESEVELMKKICNFPRIIEMTAVNFEPHRIAFYLQELAAEFHALWNKGMENPDLKFIIKDNLQLTQARICLIMAVKKIIAEGLGIFNIKAVEEM
ncbi:MAG: arginine--tRNA ligase [Alphaproteobacteria bacterium RIFCSPLOWO2_01_FULL_40_26]|nr:MAG: arginine--tRNA ligase [Alphaproteobacteria bacterium RIFCSPHIGHO2_02_FULL_40_34]OFW88362.1 MAG: arginine--tRNA ligase [Alphaproteobacteria bacterium RIFCSPHIGHO2_01_FULL_40_8]OFW94305.1 MAG: arginine--tRNA ligase [Alphaproteobacteria bacterium RIFCSPLOWO2_01_FULL_40_26]OFX09990.1 MAG: arginine--tRNA ligase [Alphaproteobacteria bacterium RIFCSPLOWO2_02_FULL_40_19]